MTSTRANLSGAGAHPIAARYTDIMRSAWLIAAAVLSLCTAAPASAGDGAPAASAERGRMLYENHCRQCHTESVHRRPNRMPLTRDELAGIVDHFRRTANLAWTSEEIDDVVEYLNRTMYRLGR